MAFRVTQLKLFCRTALLAVAASSHIASASGRVYRGGRDAGVNPFSLTSSSTCPTFPSPKCMHVNEFSSDIDSNQELSWTDVGSKELTEMLSNKNIQLIDVREPYELTEDGYIDGSVNIPLGEIGEALTASQEDFLDQYGVPKPSKDDANVVFHCRSGVRSKTALEIAHQLGYINARHYYPGYLGWQDYIDEQNL